MLGYYLMRITTNPYFASYNRIIMLSARLFFPLLIIKAILTLFYLVANVQHFTIASMVTILRFHLVFDTLLLISCVSRLIKFVMLHKRRKTTIIALILTVAVLILVIFSILYINFVLAFVYS